jgi:hypothetical protein
MRSARERQVQHGCVFRLQEHRLHGSDPQQSVSCTQKRHFPKLVTSLVVGHDLHGSDEHDAENPNNIFNLCVMYRVEPLLVHIANHHPLVDELSCAGFDFEPDVMPVRMLVLSSTAFCVCLIHVGAVCHHVRRNLSRWADSRGNTSAWCVQILLDGAARASKEPEGMAVVRLRLSERDGTLTKAALVCMSHV